MKYWLVAAILLTCQLSPADDETGRLQLRANAYQLTMHLCRAVTQVHGPVSWYRSQQWRLWIMKNGASHGLANPLAALSASSEFTRTLLDSEGFWKAADECSGGNNSGAERLAALVRFTDYEGRLAVYLLSWSGLFKVSGLIQALPRGALFLKGVAAYTFAGFIARLNREVQ
ncbi:MAG TPA: hypothetical protein VFV50_02475, partial [Bdellovibrionales bacterium]|nr:hypothetical protein [Bdellovibrionales bacterium]